MLLPICYFCYTFCSTIGKLLPSSACTLSFLRCGLLTLLVSLTKIIEQGTLQSHSLIVANVDLRLSMVCVLPRCSMKWHRFIR